MVLVKVNNYIFGGYTDQSWNLGLFGNLISFPVYKPRFHVFITSRFLHERAEEGFVVEDKIKENLFVTRCQRACSDICNFQA